MVDLSANLHMIWEPVGRMLRRRGSIDEAGEAGEAIASS